MLMVFSEVGFGSSDADADVDTQHSASTRTPRQNRELRVGMGVSAKAANERAAVRIVVHSLMSLLTEYFARPNSYDVS
jgi:hypothetical protein